MKIVASVGQPSENGIYAARQWYGWRILEWYRGEWYFSGKTAKWSKGAEIEAYIGPLPVISKDYTKPPLGIARPDEPEYDL